MKVTRGISIDEEINELLNATDGFKVINASALINSLLREHFKEELKEMQT